jgi:hypothetical protein
MLIQTTDISGAIHDCISTASSTSFSLVVPLSPMVRPRSTESYSIESILANQINRVELIITWYYGKIVGFIYGSLQSLFTDFYGFLAKKP